MSDAFSYEIQRPHARHVTIKLAGVLTAPRVSEFEPDVARVLAAGDRQQVLWDMRGVRRCDLGGRRALRRIQHAIKAKRYRTAYLASRPRIRGVALWVAHTSGDELARPFAKHEFAMDWLELSIGRVEDIELTATKLVNARGPKEARR